MSKLIKVTFENDEGVISYVEGKEAEKWDQKMIDMLIIAYSHNKKITFKDLNWKFITNKNETKEKVK